MASPKKVDSISMSSTTLNDTDLPITHLNKSDLINWLGTVTSSQVAVFFKGEGNDSGSDNHLVLAALDAQGKPSSSVQFSSDSLPCPPYCTR